MKYRGRKITRLRGYRYDKPGAYYVTICTHDRTSLFGEIVNGEMYLNAIGLIADRQWQLSGINRSEVALDEYVIMPNHVHGIIWILSSEETHRQWKDPSTGRVAFIEPTIPTLEIDLDYNRRFGGSEPHTLSTIIGAFKAGVSREVRRQFPDQEIVWQKRFYDRIVRTPFELNRIRHYIRNNPMQWHQRREYDDLIDNDGWLDLP